MTEEEINTISEEAKNIVSKMKALCCEIIID